MAGTLEGGRKAAQTNFKKYGDDFYSRIGTKGGKLGHTGGFAAGEKGRRRARVFGAIGGQKSRRGPSSVKRAEPDITPEMEALIPEGMKPVVSVIPPHKTFYVYKKR